MKYLLDTDTLIDFIQDSYQTRKRITAMLEAGDTLALCAISVVELYSGLNEQRRARWQELLSSLSYWHISREAAKHAGITRKTASDSGRTLSVSDSLIAALALENDATVLTSNIRDYPTKDVRVMSLREAA
jgi:predicted nucleic acid-binding protein